MRKDARMGELGHAQTVGQLRELLKDLPDDTPIVSRAVWGDDWLVETSPRLLVEDICHEDGFDDPYWHPFEDHIYNGMSEEEREEVVADFKKAYLIFEPQFEVDGFRDLYRTKL